MFSDLIRVASLRRSGADGYMVAWTGWVPPVTVSSPSRRGSRQAAQTVRGWKSAPQVCWKMVPFRAGGLEYFPTIPNPVGISALTQAVFELFALVIFIVILVATISLPLRFRRARGDERQQLKWVAYAAVFLGVVGLGAPLLAAPLLSAILTTLAFIGFAIAIAVAILKYRLYDIDRLINRTLVYGLLTVPLGAVYAGVALLLGQLFGGIGTEPPSWAVAGATLAVAALFQPARRRIQAVVDRRFNRRKYDVATTIEAFSARLRDEVDLDSPCGRAAHGSRADDAADHGVTLAAAIGPATGHRDLNCPRGVLAGALLASTRPSSWPDVTASSIMYPLIRGVAAVP
jgi:hypothetical protein